MKKNVKDFIDKIKTAKSIAIAGHKNPDGDSLCSVLALARLIHLNFNKKTVCVYDGNIPDCLDNVPDRKNIIYFEHIDLKKVFDLVILLDYGTENHLGGFLEICKNAKVIAEIDHHKNDAPLADICIDDIEASSVGEIIYDLICTQKLKFDDAILELLATSIITDTGNFKYVCHGKTLRIMAEMVDAGISIKNISNALNNKPRKSVITEAGAAANTEFFYKGRLALATVDEKDYKNLDGRGDLILSILEQIKGLEYIVLLKRQKENQTGVSLRSKTKPIDHIANALGGGGHLNAAGAVVRDTIENVREKVLTLFKGMK